MASKKLRKRLRSRLTSDPVITTAFSLITILTGILLLNNILYNIEIPASIPGILGIFWLGTGLLVLSQVIR